MLEKRGLEGWELCILYLCQAALAHWRPCGSFPKLQHQRLPWQAMLLPRKRTPSLAGPTSPCTLAFRLVQRLLLDARGCPERPTPASSPRPSMRCRYVPRSRPQLLKRRWSARLSRWRHRPARRALTPIVRGAVERHACEFSHERHLCDAFLVPN